MNTGCRLFWFRLLLLPLCIALPLREPDAPRAAETFTMEQAVARAMQANPGVEAKMLLLEQARLNVGVAQSYFWPRVSLVGTTSRVQNYEEVQTYNSDNLTSDNWSKGLRASLSLFAGFAHLNNLQKSRIAVEVEKARHRQARLELGSNVQLQFLQLLKCREDLKSAEEAVARIETQLKAAEAFVKVGMAPYVNVLQNRAFQRTAAGHPRQQRHPQRGSAAQQISGLFSGPPCALCRQSQKFLQQRRIHGRGSRRRCHTAAA